MSDCSLPSTIEPFKYTDQTRVLEGKTDVAPMSRLVEMLAKPTGQVDVELRFGRDEQNQPVVSGTLSSILSLTCERCLEPVEKPVKSEFSLGIVLNDDQAKNLPGYYEPLLVEPESLNVLELVEEELILSLPMFAYHEHCDGLGVTSAGPEGETLAEPEVKRENPFQVLSDLKLKK